MRKFFALLKVSLKAALLTSSGVGAGQRRRAVSGVGAALLIAFLGLSLSGAYSFILVDTLSPVGMESLALVFMGLMALLGGLLFTVFAVKGVLFGGRDNDLILSLPVPAEMIVASRMLAIYLENLVFSLFVLLPAGAACFFLAGGYDWGLWPRLVVAAVCLPLLDTALSVAVGAALAFLSSKVSRGKVLGQNLVMAVFLVGIFYLSFHLNGLLEGLASHAAGLKAGMTWAAPMLWMADGVLGNWGLLLAFAACCAVPFAVVTLILGKGYRQAVTAFQTRAARSDYKLSHQRAKGQRRALLSKEARKFFGSSTYFWNGGLGLMLLLAAAVAALVKGEDLRLLLAQLDGAVPGVLLAGLVMGFCLCTTVICAPSVSLEGRCLWILRAAPVTEQTLLWTKTGFQLLFTLPCTAVAAICLTWALALPLWHGAALLVAMAAFSVGNACFGTMMGLFFPKLDCANEALIIKQSLSGFLAMFVPMGVLALGALAWWLGGQAGPQASLLAPVGLFAAWGLACGVWLARRGPALLLQLG